MMRKYLSAVLILAVLLFTFAGCGETRGSDLSNGEVQSNTTTADSQVPEEGYYSNDYDEILKIKKKDDGTYNIEYSITHLLYVENAVGIYDSETGILSFSGEDDRGNDIKADIKNKGDHLEVTVTQSNYKDVVGTTQDFSPADRDE